MKNAHHLADLSLAAEVRAVEAGHHAVMRGDRTVSVVSDSTPGQHWLVRAFTAAPGEPVLFECRAEDAELAVGRGHPPLVSRMAGCCPCMHASVAARRLEREGFVQWVGGVWVATDKAAPVADDDSDPFACFPRLAS